MIRPTKLFLSLVFLNLSAAAMEQDPEQIIAQGTEDQIIALLENGYDYNTKVGYKEERIPLIYAAAAKGHVTVLEFLQSKGVNLNTPVAEGRCQGQAPIHFAAAYGHTNVIKHLQSQEVNLNTPSTEGPAQGWTPIHCAAAKDQVKVIEYLQSKGVDINAPIAEGPCQGYAPIHCAAANGQVAVIEYLHSQGIDINTPVAEGPDKGHAPMHIAAATGYVEVIKYIQSQGIDINIPVTQGPNQGCTPVHVAATNGQVDVIEYLKSKGVDINASVVEGIYQGGAPIHFAAANGQVAVIEYLQSKQVDINTRVTVEGSKGQTALCLAAQGSSLPTIQTLIWLGAQRTLLGPNNNRTAVEYARDVNNDRNAAYLQQEAPHTQSMFSCFELIREKVLRFNKLISEHINGLPDQEKYDHKKILGSKPIQALMDSYNKECSHPCTMIKDQLEEGAEINALGLNGTPLHCCVQLYSPFGPTEVDELAKDIIKRGADINVVDRDGYTPLGRACLYNNQRLIRLFLRHGADPVQGINPFRIAVETNNPQLLDALPKLAGTPKKELL